MFSLNQITIYGQITFFQSSIQIKYTECLEVLKMYCAIRHYQAS